MFQMDIESKWVLFKMHVSVQLVIKKKNWLVSHRLFICPSRLLSSSLIKKEFYIYFKKFPGCNILKNVMAETCLKDFTINWGNVRLQLTTNHLHLQILPFH